MRWGNFSLMSRLLVCKDCRGASMFYIHTLKINNKTNSCYSSKTCIILFISKLLSQFLCSWVDADDDQTTQTLLSHGSATVFLFFYFIEYALTLPYIFYLTRQSVNGIKRCYVFNACCQIMCTLCMQKMWGNMSSMDFYENFTVC